jgi:DNA repair exonuclease SbcCD ATPase subunit
MAADETINIEVKSNLGELNKDIGNTSKLVQGVERSVDGAQRAMDAFGVSSDTTNKSLEGVQTAMNFTDGIQQITNLGKVIKTNTTVTRIWNLAMKANPIGFLVTAVMALIAGITALIFWMKKSSEQSRLNTKLTKESTKALKKQTKAIDDNAKAFDRKQKQELAMAKASGESVEAIRTLEIKLVDEKLAYIASERAIAKQTLAKERNTLATLKARGAEEDLIDEQLKNVVQAVDNFNTLNKAIGDTLIERGDLLNRHIVERKQAETDARREAEDARQDAIDKELEDIEKANQAKIDAEEKLQKDLEDVRDKAAKDFEKLQIGQADAFERRAKKDMAIEKAVADYKVETTKNAIGAAAALAGENAAASKGVAAAQVVFNTQQGIMAAMGATSVADKLLPYPLRLANAIATGVMGATALQKIMSTNHTAGSSSGSGVPSATPATPAPQMMSGAFELSGGLEPEPTRAYVVTDEMTNSQNQLANIRRRATI